MHLFQYVVYYVPNKEQEEKGLKAEIIVPFTVELAKTKGVLSTKLVRALDEKWMEMLDQIKICIMQMP